MTAERETSSPADDTALLAMQNEADIITGICSAFSVALQGLQTANGAESEDIALRGRKAAQEAAAKVWIEVHDSIARTRAHTIAGMQFKVRFSPTPWLDPVMMRSIVEDLLRMDRG